MELDTRPLMRALNLKERLPALKHHPPFTINQRSSNRRLEAWKAQSPFQDHEIFRERLSADGINETDLLALLGQADPIREPHDEPPAAWMRFALEAIAVYPNLPKVDLFRSGDTATYFLVIVDPLIRHAMAHLSDWLRTQSQTQELGISSAELTTLLFSNVPRRLASIVSPTGVLELQVAKVAGQLQADSPGKGFSQFIESISTKKKILALWTEYPVLIRAVTIWLTQWLDTSKDFVTRLASDAGLISELLFDKSPLGRLENILWNAGDRHKGGSSVAIVHFSEQRKVVYKPRSLAIDHNFSLLIKWLHQTSGIELRTPRALDRGSYGWTEYIEHTPSRSQEETDAFYHRLGSLMALLYVLEATDLHNENLIASGAFPVPVDLETLFSAGPLKEAVRDTYSPAEFAVLSSVLRMGMLPHKQWTVDGDSVELSGVGGQKGQFSLHSVPLWEKGGTDEMRLTRRRVEMAAAKNLPQLEVSPLEFKPNIAQGFERMYRFAMDRAEEMEEKISDLFARDRIRLIFRNTGFYSLLLSESFHPNLMRDALERDRHFDRLWFGLRHALIPEKVRLLFDSERDALWRGDIPHFEVEMDSTDLLTCNGSRLSQFFTRSPLGAAIPTLRSLSETDLKRQLWMIDTSLTTLAKAGETTVNDRRYLSNSNQELSRDELLACALRVGQRIEELALTKRDEASWIGLTLINEKHWDLRPLGLDLYSGVPGIVLFLAYLAQATQIDRYTKLAEAGLSTIRAQIKRVKREFRVVGAFEGWSGLIYLYSHLFHLWNDLTLQKEVGELIDATDGGLESDKALDVIGGTAGAILVLNDIQTEYPRIESLLRKAGAILTARAEAADVGRCWRVQVSPSHPLAGFSHGAAGFALSLMVLSKRLHDSSFKDLAMNALSFENSLFSERESNWPDLRGSSDRSRSSFMTAWCHGSPGIGLSRLRLAEYIGLEAVEKDIDSAVRNTIARGFGGSHCLCHGDLGNLDFLLEASQHAKWRELKSTIDQRSAAVTASIRRGEWISGVPHGAETPGLMNGLAGIGYGLLRLAAPRKVPSILVLDPPR